MRLPATIACLLLLAAPVRAETVPAPSSYEALQARLADCAAATDPGERFGRVTGLWNGLAQAGCIPFVGGRWILDPANPRTQRSGFGDNSELRLPGYEPSPWVERRAGVRRGALTARVIESGRLGYAVHYQVYAPAG